MKNWYKTSINEIFKIFNSNNNGLTNNQVEEYQKTYGLNELPKKAKKNFFQIFIEELIDPIVLLLVVMAIISFLTNEVVDGTAIIFIVLVDLIMGTLQELKAQDNVEEITNLIKDITRVKRNNKETEIETKYLVPGDIVLLESGNRIGADLRIINSNNLSINESILTGESLNVYKDDKKITEDVTITERTNMLYAGTYVTSGRAKCIVVETALNTEIGKIASSINEIKEPKSPLSLRMEKFSKQITLMIVIIAIIITAVLLLKGMTFKDMFLSVIALSVSAMPEGLPLALTMALTIASNKMSKKHVIVKKLRAAESLGSCTVIATDKTGTLTVNEQTAKKIILPNNFEYDISGTGYKIEGKITGNNDINLLNNILVQGYLNNDSIVNIEQVFGDSIDIAFKVMTLKSKIKIPEVEIVKSIPYESENKYSAIFYKEDNKLICAMKGSIETVLSYCKYMRYNDEIIKLDKDKLIEQNLSLANQGYRVIALASNEQKTTDKIDNLIFEGLVAFIDPIRKEVKKAIQECSAAGIKVKMITGDHPLTALNIAKELKIANDINQVTTTEELSKYYEKDKKELDKFVASISVFSRVTPTDKLKIVESLKRQKEFVAVTGDGVNDSPALAAASIGVAMGSGTDVAKESADLIITDDNFSSIVDGIKEGRIAYSNIRKVCYMLLSCGLAEVLFFLISIIFNMPMPLVAIQLLWLNIVTDGLQDFALSFEKAEQNIMKQKPRPTEESVFNKELFEEIIISGIFIAVLVFGLWYYLVNINHMPIEIARGYIMAEMVFIQNIHVLNCRSEINSTFKISLKSNILILVTIIGSILLQIIVMEVEVFSKILQTTRIPVIDLIKLFALSTIILVVMEIYKKIKRNNNKEKN